MSFHTESNAITTTIKYDACFDVLELNVYCTVFTNKSKKNDNLLEWSFCSICLIKSSEIS